MKNIEEIRKTLFILYNNITSLSTIGENIYLDYNKNIEKLEIELNQELGDFKITKNDLSHLKTGGGFFCNRLTGEMQERPIKQSKPFLKKELFLIKLERVLLLLENYKEKNMKKIGFDLN